MSRTYRDHFTVVDIFRELGLQTSPADTWAAGAAAREAYLSATGSLPIKDNRTKTAGGGSHCFALYPPAWRPKVTEIVLGMGIDRDRQGSIWDILGPPPEDSR